MRFVCDGSLGGLARWLRRGAVVLTSDHEVFLRRQVKDGRLAALHVPSRDGLPAQLALVVRTFGLEAREPRCMACGGPLRPVAKVDVQARIPPRTVAWKDEHFLCDGCGQLFWKGTHLDRIRRRLKDAGFTRGRWPALASDTRRAQWGQDRLSVPGRMAGSPTATTHGRLGGGRAVARDR